MRITSEQLVKKECANYIDGECNVMISEYSLLCRYCIKNVLPLNNACVKGTEEAKKECKICKKEFHHTSKNEQYCKEAKNQREAT